MKLVVIVALVGSAFVPTANVHTVAAEPVSIAVTVSGSGGVLA